MNERPASGVAEPTFVDRVLMFTDIEGSTTRWDNDTETMRILMRHHDALVEDAIERHGGRLGARTGDGAIALFERASDAVRSAVALQSGLGEGPRAMGVPADPLRVRIGIHRGVVEPRNGEHYGPPMHRTARIMSAGNGGQVLLSKVVADELRRDGSRPAGVTLVDCGLHRLKGFHEPEQLTEVLIGDVVGHRPSLRTENAVEGWLPTVDESSFIGRDADVERILPLLRSGSVVTMVGTGGVGKTRLAVHLAQQARAAFPGGVWFVDLAAISSPDRVLSAIADALGLSDERAVSLAEPLRHALASRQALVVLDNCEHVLEGVAAAVRTVMFDGAASALLCTSQRDLGVRGERVEPIAPLTFEADIEASPAGRLFLLHVRRLDPSFVLDTVGKQALRAICSRLDGLPLALELAASRSRVMSLPDIAEHLRTRFDLLRSRDHHERHRTLTAAITWSAELLDPADRDVLIDLSVFNGRFSWQAAVAVSGRDELDVLDSIEELVRRSLLVRVDDGFRLLVPLRLHFTDALVASGRAEEVRARHAAWVVGTVPIPFDHIDATVVAGRIDAVLEAIDDIHAAHDWLVAHDPAGAARFALSLVDTWITRGRSLEAIARLEECDTEATPPELRVRVLGWLAGFGWTAGRNELGESAARRALDLAVANDLPLPAMAATRLAVRLAFSNRIDEALPLALAVVDAVEDEGAEGARLLGPLSIVVGLGGDLPAAVVLADRGVAEARKVGALRVLTALTNRLLLAPTDPAAGDLTIEAAALARAVGRMSAVAHAAAAMAHRSRQAGDLPGFLRGITEFADLMIEDEPTAVVGMFRLVPEAVASQRPREAAMLLGALAALGRAHDHPGTDQELERLAKVSAEVISILGDDEHLRAYQQGEAMTLSEAVDLLHWLSEF